MLGSGSAGNAVLIECGGSRILVDCGFGTRTLAGRLKAIDVAPASIEACIVTHEHADHIGGAAAGARKWGWQLYASRGTMNAWPALVEASCIQLGVGTAFALERMQIDTCAIPHDAAMPIGVRVTSSSTGASAVVCTDLGHVNDGIRTLCADADLLILESNHDEGMLRTGSYPPSVRARIGSRVGHLSNRACAQLARDMVHKNLSHVVLAHLSENCNDHGTAHRATANALSLTRYRGAVSVAMQHTVVGPFTPKAGRTQHETQYAFAL